MTDLPTFSVAAMMRENAAVVRRFVAFYRALGAERIFLFYDAPVERLAGLDLDGVELAGLDAAFWASLGRARPEAVEQVQAAVHMLALQRCASDWLLVVDADEFLVGAPPGELLARVPADVDVLRIRNAEAVWGPGDDISQPFGSTHFRKPLPRRTGRTVARLLYGQLAPFFNRGLIGHSRGKQFVRRGADVDEVLNHDSRRAGQPVGRWADELIPEARATFVAHFDAIDFERWREKWRRRYSGESRAVNMSSSRAAQMRAVEAALSAGDGARAQGLFRRLYGLGPAQRAVLRALGCLVVADVFGRARTQGGLTEN